MMHASTASTIRSAVEIALSKAGASSVTVVGHSLGGALALLDGIYFRLHLPQNVGVRVVTYGMPRVGNQAFADLIDSELIGHVTHVNNREDPIPTVPGILSGFHHPSGEIHIQDYGTWDACPGAFFFLPVFGCGSIDRTMSDVLHNRIQVRIILPSYALSAM
jgi:Lipase (class 3)